MPRHIVITGATSGIGRAIAIHYAKPGIVLGLSGRDTGRLDEVSARCRELGAEVQSLLVDVTERATLMTALHSFDSSWPVDLLVANAGVMAGTPPSGLIEDAEAASDLLKTNVLGLQNTVHSLLPTMMQRRKGQIAIMGSLAGFIPLPDAPSYCASKSAAMAYGLSLRAGLRDFGIKVSVVCPGYVDTPMAARESGTQPFKMPAKKAAEMIARGLEKDRALIVFPRLFGWLTRLGGILPDRIRGRLVGRFTVS